MDFEFIGIEQAEEITKKTEEVAESYAEACNALREASKKVSELQAILPPDMCIRLSDEFVGSFPLPGFRLPYEIRALPTHPQGANGGNGGVDVFGKSRVDSADLNQMSSNDSRTKKRYKRADDRKRSEHHSSSKSESSSTEIYKSSKTVKKHQDQSPTKSKSIVLKASSIKGRSAKTTVNDTS
ncbi:7971_t:CDS:2, partial [Ambispora leptoticha]